MMQRTYTDADLGELSFHDVHVYGYAALPDLFEIRFDIDYLVEWLCPAQEGFALSFRTSPATLVFENAGTVEANLKTPQGDFSLNELVRSGFEQLPGARLGTWQYDLRGHDECSVRLRASGFRLHIRAEPVISYQQQLPMDQRSGISFAIPAAPARI
jgi:hypothetical protein